MNKLENGESPAVSPEVKERIREGLPRLCKAMAELALSRVQAQGLESPSCRNSYLSGVGFSARYDDPHMPHSDGYKARQQENLESVRKYVEEDDQTDEIDLKRLHELEAYAALSDEQKVGGVAVASFVMAGGDTGSGWTLESIGATMEYAGYAKLTNSGIGSAEVATEGTKLRRGYSEPINLDVLLRTIDIFEQAKEEDIQVDLRVTI